MTPEGVRSFQGGSDFHGLTIAGRDNHQGNHFHEHTHTHYHESQSPASTEQDQANLRDLRVVDPRNDPETIENRTEPLFLESSEWILDPEKCKAFASWKDGESSFPSCRLLWISGQPGTGKTMLMITIIRDLETGNPSSSRSLSYFFFQRKEKALANGRAMLRSLIWLLLKQQPRLMPHLQAKLDESGQDLYNDSNTFTALSDVLLSMLKDPLLSPVDFIVDAIDECDLDESILKTLFRLIKKSLEASVKVSWLVSSRPEIAAKFQAWNWGISKALIELDTEKLQAPVTTYIAHKLGTLEGKPGYTESCLEEISAEIHQKANNVFLWVSVVLRTLDSQSGWSAIQTLKELPSELSDLFDSMMTRLEHGTEKVDFLRSVLATVFLAYSPLTLDELTVLADFKSTDMTRHMVTSCSSFLTIDGETVSLLHESMRQYLESNYEPKLRQGQVVQGHATIYKRSMDAMSDLRKNMHGTTDLGYNPCGSPPCHASQLPFMPYACLFWIDHLCKSEGRGPAEELADNGKLTCFLKRHLLHWLEALSLIGRSYDSMGILQRLADIVPESTCRELSSFLGEAIRFIGKNGRTIATAPMQIYSSAIIFSPKQSQIRNTFRHQIPRWVLSQPQTDDNWSSHSHALSDLKEEIDSLAFSPNSKLLAAQSQTTRTLAIWQLESGRCLHLLHDGENKACNHIFRNGFPLVFSADSATLIFSSVELVQIWGVETGEVLKEIDCSDRFIFSTAYSNRGFIACYVDDGGVEVWDATTALLHSKLDGYTGKETTDVTHVHETNQQAKSGSLAFSPDERYLALMLGDRSVRIWCTETWASITELRPPDNDKIYSMSFAADSQWIALATFSSIRIHSSDTGALMQQISDSRASTSLIAYPGSVLISFGAQNRGIWVWHAMTGDLKIQLPTDKLDWSRHHSVVSFGSSNHARLAVWGTSQSLKVWDIDTGCCLQELIRSRAKINTVATSPDQRWIASVNYKYQVRVWDARLAIDSQQSEDKPEEDLKTYLSSDLSLIASRLSDGKRTTWTIRETGANQNQFKFVVNRRPQDAIFSPDKKYILLFGDGLFVGCIQDQKLLFDVLEHEWRYHTAAVFSPNSKLFACSKGGLLAVWHLSTGQTPMWILRFQNTDLVNRPLSFSSDSGQLLSGRGTEVHIWDVVDGRHLSSFSTESKKPSRGTRERRRELQSLTCTNELETVALGWSDRTVEFRSCLTGDCLRVVQLDHVPYYLSVESGGKHLCTERGVFSTGTSTPGQVESRQSLAIGINLDQDWIKWGSHRLLLLPAELKDLNGHEVRGSWVILRNTVGGAQYIQFDTTELARVYKTSQ